VSKSISLNTYNGISCTRRFIEILLIDIYTTILKKETLRGNKAYYKNFSYELGKDFREKKLTLFLRYISIQVSPCIKVENDVEFED